MSRIVSPNALEVRDLSDRETDASALRAIAQAAINVELFTIPLYMATLYSIRGTHPITGSNDFYEGRLWPGPAASASPKTANEKAFNIIFSVFIEEMLHLQLASNMATAIGVKPTFTSPVLQGPTHGWTCYGPDETVLPHIVDLRDTVDAEVRVNLGALTRDQLKLFLAIEEPEDQARKRIVKGRYFPSVPFDGWTPEKIETDLPPFGTIGWMYQCYYDYMNQRYDNGDGTTSTLFDFVFTPGSQQNDMFNVTGGGHPMAEYPGFGATITATDAAGAFTQAVDMMDAITDQGEGSLIKKSAALLAVQSRYQADEKALTADYPDFTDTGRPGPVPSSDAVARAGNGGLDHYERFLELARDTLDEVETWPAWFAKGNRWQAADLQAGDADLANPYGLPTPQAVADALNNMAEPESRDSGYRLLCQAAAGSIAGVTTVLNDYWAMPDQTFPYPSMAGSGDRMAICWAIFGQAPDLSIGLGARDPKLLYHTCQALGIETPGNECAAVAVFHACKGSNSCKAEGGCGFVHTTTSGGGLCGSQAFKARESGCGAPPPNADPATYSAPSDNKCATFGGCASPISASQILPPAVDADKKPLPFGTMLVFDFGPAPGFAPTKIGTLQWTKGEKVHDVAYKAYRQVMEARGVEVPAEPPPPNDLRLAFPPST